MWLCVSSCKVGNAHVIDEEFCGWQVAPTGDQVKGGTRESVIMGYPAGSMVELFHPDHDADVIGKGRCGKECKADGIPEEYRDMGAQAVTITECLMEGVPIILELQNEPQTRTIHRWPG